MKIHLIKYVSGVEDGYYTTTYCGLNSDTWSEEFAEKENLTDNSYFTNCKNCKKSFLKELRDYEENIFK